MKLSPLQSPAYCCRSFPASFTQYVPFPCLLPWSHSCKRHTYINDSDRYTSLLARMYIYMTVGCDFEIEWGVSHVVSTKRAAPIVLDIVAKWAIRCRIAPRWINLKVVLVQVHLSIYLSICVLSAVGANLLTGGGGCVLHTVYYFFWGTVHEQAGTSCAFRKTPTCTSIYPVRAGSAIELRFLLRNFSDTCTIIW